MRTMRTSARDVLTLRRTLWALLSAAVALVLAGGTLGFATATAGPSNGAAAEFPATFSVPDVRIGDAADYRSTTYEIQPDGSRLRVGGVEHFPAFTYAADIDVFDPDGRASVGHAIDVRYWFYDTGGATETQEVVILDDSVPRAVHQRIRTLNSHRESTEGGLLGPRDASTDTQQTSRDWSRGAGPCEAANALQGQIVDTARLLDLFGYCDFLPVESPLFLATGSEVIDGRVRMLFDHVPSGAPGDQRILAEFADDNPYPLRIEIGPRAGQSTVEVRTLVGYTRGSTELRHGPPILSDAPALAWADAPAWGIDDAAIDHPFKLSVAFEAARDDPTNSTFRDWLALHPSAFTATARYDVSTTNEQTARTWSIGLSDGTDGYVLRITATEHVGYGMLWPPAAPDLPEAARLLSYVGGESSHEVAPASARVTRTPTAASLLGRWDALEASIGGHRSAEAYGFTSMATEWVEGERVNIVRRNYEAGLVTMDWDWFYAGTIPTQDQAVRRDEALLRFDATGSMLVGVGMAFDFTMRSNLRTGPYSVSEGNGGQLSVSNVGARTVPVWRMLTTAEVVGAGIVAAAAGLLVWLWPALKSIAIAPFYSRIARPRALDHANRDTLHEIVRAEPGLHFQEIARRSGMGRGTVDHHLRKLVQTGILTQVAGPGYTCYFVAGAVDRRAMNGAPLLKAAGARQVVDAVARSPGASLSQVARSIGASVPSVHQHVHRLSDAGLLRIERKGASVELYVTHAKA